jgi:hypothetical protein
VDLDSAQRAVVSHRLRGGNWAQGPWPLSGGPPATYLIAYDVAPQFDGAEHGRAINGRIPLAKLQVRARLLAEVPPGSRYNPVHSSDNPGQALDYLEALGDVQLLERISLAARQLVDSCAFPYPVVRALSGLARRAQVAVVEHPVHGHAVCKLFRPGAVRFFERELRARRELGDLPEVPDLLEHGDRWLLTTMYQDDGRHIRRRLHGGGDVQITPAASRALASFAVALHEHGLFLLDLSTQNLVSDSAAGLKVLDLEFLQEYQEHVPNPHRSYTFWGVPDGSDSYDVPQRTRLITRMANPAFHPAVTGSSVEALLRPYRPLDKQRRALVQLGWYQFLLLNGRYREARASLFRTWWVRDLLTLRSIVSRQIRRPWHAAVGRRPR